MRLSQKSARRVGDRRCRHESAAAGADQEVNLAAAVARGVVLAERRRTPDMGSTVLPELEKEQEKEDAIVVDNFDSHSIASGILVHVDRVHIRNHDRDLAQRHHDH